MDINFENYKSGRLIPFILILSVLLEALVNEVKLLFKTQLEQFEILKKCMEYIDILSVVFLIGCVLIFIDKIGWKLKIFKWLIDIPNLNGRYKGKIKASILQDNQIKILELDTVIEVLQTSSMLKLNSYDGPTSSGESFAEKITKNNDGFFRIYHGYKQVWRTGKDIQTRTGLCELKYIPQTKTLTGNYFNDSRNHGIITVALVNSKLAGDFE